MKTIYQNVIAAVVAVAGSAVAAHAAGPADFGLCPDGFCGTTTSGYANEFTGGFGARQPMTADCGHVGCTNGVCEHDAVYGPRGVAEPLWSARITAPRTPAGAYSAYPAESQFRQTNYRYGASDPAACQFGRGPVTPLASYNAGYAPAIRAGGCVTPNGSPMPMPRYQSSRPTLFSVLGLTR